MRCRSTPQMEFKFCMESELDASSHPTIHSSNRLCNATAPFQRGGVCVRKELLSQGRGGEGEEHLDQPLRRARAPRSASICVRKSMREKWRRRRNKNSQQKVSARGERAILNREETQRDCGKKRRKSREKVQHRNRCPTSLYATPLCVFVA